MELFDTNFHDFIHALGQEIEKPEILPIDPNDPYLSMYRSPTGDRNKWLAKNLNPDRRYNPKRHVSVTNVVPFQRRESGLSRNSSSSSSETSRRPSIDYEIQPQDSQEFEESEELIGDDLESNASVLSLTPFPLERDDEDEDAMEQQSCRVTL